MKLILPAVDDRFLVDRKSNKRGASVLCFDEIQTIDVFAVVALSGIVSRLLSTGTVLVATSNRAPEYLNQDGMQQDIFLKLVAKLEKNCNNILDHYFWPLVSGASEKLSETWDVLTAGFGGRITSQVIPVMFGRNVEVSESCNGMAKFTFEYLCSRRVGAADYIAITRTFHTVFMSDIPGMSMCIRVKERRFMTLVDELYNHHCFLYCNAATDVDDLFQGTDEGTLFDLESFRFETEMEGGGKLRRDVFAAGSVSSGGSSGVVSLLSGQEEMFAFRRAVSRLVEMQTIILRWNSTFSSIL